MSFRPISQIPRVGAYNPRTAPTRLICTEISKNQKYHNDSPATCQRKFFDTPSKNILKPYKFKRASSTLKIINPSKIFRFPAKSKRCLHTGIHSKTSLLFQHLNNANNFQTSKAFFHTFKSVSTGIPIKLNNILKEPKRQTTPATSKKISTKIIHFFLNKLKTNKQYEDIDTEINKLQSRTNVSTKYLQKKKRNSLSLIKKTRKESKLSIGKPKLRPIGEICIDKLVKQLPKTTMDASNPTIYVFNTKSAKQQIEPFIKDASSSYKFKTVTENLKKYKYNNQKPFLTTKEFNLDHGHTKKMKLPLISEMQDNYFLSNIRNNTQDNVDTCEINICKPTKLEKELKNYDKFDVELQNSKKNGMCNRISKHNKNLFNILKTASLHTLDKRVNTNKKFDNSRLTVNKIYSKTKLKNKSQYNTMKQQEIDNSYENYLNEFTSKPIGYKQLINIIKADSETMMELITARQNKIQEKQEVEMQENKTCTPECTCRACIEKLTNSIAKTLNLNEINNPEIHAKNIAKRKLGYSTSPRIRYINRVYLKEPIKGRRYYSKKRKDDCSTTPPEVPPIAKCNSCSPGIKKSTTQNIDYKEKKRNCVSNIKPSKPKSACELMKKPKKKKIPQFKMEHCCPKLRPDCQTYKERPCKKLEAPYNSFSERFSGFMEEDKTECEDFKTKGLQPRNQKSPKILLVEATTPKFAQVDPDLERRCLKDKKCECEPEAVDNTITFKCKTQFESKECPPRGRKHCEDFKNTTCTKLNAPYKSFQENCPQFPEVEYTECDLAEKLADATTKDLGRKCKRPPPKSPLQKECDTRTGEPVVKKGKDEIC